jgi:cyclopropane fatty-acyl-phospholipid synthase-like methyltransferase
MSVCSIFQDLRKINRMQHEFDSHAQTYKEVLDESINFSGEDSAYFSEYKIRDLKHELLKANVDLNQNLRLMDFGCGVGSSVPYARKHFPLAEIFGVDVSMDSLEEAQARYDAIARFLPLKNDELPDEASRLDAAFAMCVFHHIDEREHVRILADIRSRLKHGAMMMIYEHNPLNPLTVRVVNNCPFDENAKLIKASLMVKRCQEAGYKDIKVRYRVFFPHFLRSLRFAERALSWLPLGGQYYVRCIA